MKPQDDILDVYRQYREEVDILLNEEAVFVLSFVQYSGSINLGDLARSLQWDMEKVANVCKELKKSGLISAGGPQYPSTEIRLLQSGVDFLAMIFGKTALLGSTVLIQYAQSEGEDYFRLIFDRYARPIFSFIYDMVGRRDLAEELTQETFVRAYKNLGGLQDNARLSTWLFGIAKNVARESLRTRQRVEIDAEGGIEVRDEKLPPDRELLDKELNNVIADALSALDQDKRMVFTLKILQQRSDEEIAEITGFSIPKLKTDLHRARAEMKRRVGKSLSQLRKGNLSPHEKPSM